MLLRDNLDSHGSRGYVRGEAIHLRQLLSFAGRTESLRCVPFVETSVQSVGIIELTIPTNTDEGLDRLVLTKERKT